MSPGLFQHFASEDVGVIYVVWSLAGSAAKTTTTVSFLFLFFLRRIGFGVLGNCSDNGSEVLTILCLIDFF